MTFADEPAEYADRCFDCGWAERAQTAADIAQRVQELAQRLGLIDPAYARIRPDPGMRKFRAGDLGPILDMGIGELAGLIERRGRFDPPRFPAPVSPQGYRVLFRNDLMGPNPSHLSVTVRAGSRECGANENGVRVWPEINHSVWRDPERGIQVLEAMVETWDAEWAIAFAYGVTPPVKILEGPTPVRPWLAWTAKPLQPRPNPPYHRPYPSFFPLDYAGPPGEVRPCRGGELRIWP